MSRPARSPGWWVARALGVCCGPTLMPFALLLVAERRGGSSLPLGASALFLLFTSGLPILLVVVGVLVGRVRDLGVSHHEDRRGLVWLGASSGIGGAWLLWWLGSDQRLAALAAAVATQAIVLAGLTAHEKVSYHSAGVGSLAAAGWLLLGSSVGLGAGLLALATGWSRWWLGRHTVRQVVLGYATSLAALPWLMAYPAN